MRSPDASRAVSILCPFTNVPFVLSRSRTSSPPSGRAVTRQCTRDTSAASTMKSAPVARPIVRTPPGRTRNVFSGSPSVTVRRIHIGMCRQLLWYDEAGQRLREDVGALRSRHAVTAVEQEERNTIRAERVCLLMVGAHRVGMELSRQHEGRVR